MEYYKGIDTVMDDYVITSVYATDGRQTSIIRTNTKNPGQVETQYHIGGIDTNQQKLEPITEREFKAAAGMAMSKTFHMIIVG